MKKIAGIPDTCFVFTIFFLFFLLNLTSNFSGPHDSMGYLNDLEKGRDLFPAPHLLYHYIAFQLFHVLRSIFGHVPDYFLAEVVDAIWGCLGLTVVYRIFIHRMKMTRAEAFLGTCVVAFSFGMWFYCSNIEVYMPSVLFLLLGLFLCTKDQLNNRDVILITIVHCLAVLFHQSNVLFTPIVIWKFWDSRKTIPFFASLVRYGLISIAVVGGVYFIFGWIVDGNNNPKDFMTWVRGYTTASNYWFPFNLNTLLKAGIGFGHAFFGGHFVFRVKFLETFMNRLFFYHSLDDEAYLVRQLSHGVALLLLVLTVLVGLFMLVSLIRIIVHFRQLYATNRRVMVPLLLFLLIYSCFFFFWMPENLEFWIPQSVVFWIFVLGMTRQLPPLPGTWKYYRIYGGLAAMIFIINYFGSILWMKDINNDSVYVKIRKVKEVATAKDLIILQDPWLLDDFLEHFTKSKISPVPVERKAVQALDASVDSCLSAGGRIYLFTEGGSLMHSSKNLKYVDSLIIAKGGKVSDLKNELTPVKVIAN